MRRLKRPALSELDIRLLIEAAVAAGDLTQAPGDEAVSTRR